MARAVLTRRVEALPLLDVVARPLLVLVAGWIVATWFAPNSPLIAGALVLVVAALGMALLQPELARDAWQAWKWRISRSASAADTEQQ